MTYGSVNQSNPLLDQNDIEVVSFQPETKKANVSKAILLSFLLIGASMLAVSSYRSSFDVVTESDAVSLLFPSMASANGGRVTYSLLSDDQKQLLFTDFVQTYGRTYAQDAEEFEKRLAVFKANLEVSDTRNRAEAAVNGTAVHGITRFMDLTAEEFTGTYLMDTSLANSGGGNGPSVPTVNKMAINSRRLESLRRGSDPTLVYVDWSDSITTGVKNGGDCAGSWAIAAAEQIESDAIKAGIITTRTELSAQQILSCTTKQSGCSYGDIGDAYTDVQKPGGVYSALSYPWTAGDGEVDECYYDSSMEYSLTLGSYFSLNEDGNPYNTERLIIDHLTSKGTLSVCLDATIWSTYVSGTMSNCDGNEVNHCVQIVGMYYSSAADTGFYKIRNSWGTDWGINGYISLSYGGDVCSVATDPMYTDPVKDN